VRLPTEIQELSAIQTNLFEPEITPEDNQA
jgi:hypothetical protein